jgi:hypothetical protein
VKRIVYSLDDLKELFGKLKEAKTPFLVEVTEKQSRSQQQNSLMWQWAGDVSDQTGYSPAEVQARWKAKFGIPILSEDEKYRALYERIPWREGSHDDIMRMIEYLPVTSEMTTKQMTQFLDRVHEYHVGKQHILTDPEKMIW